MSQVSRPMQIALGATLLLLVVWFLALRPKSATTDDTAVAPVTPAQEAPTATPPAEEESPAAPAAPAAPRAVAARAFRPRPGDTAAVRSVRAALRARKAVAIGFVTPTVADARAVDVELRHVSSLGGRAAVFSVSIDELSRFGFITRGVDVTVAPTTIVIAPDRTATTIVGFADRFEIEQRLADALR
jgi:hypothetical protein